MKTIPALSIAATLACGPAFAASTTELKVVGAIKPTACVPNLLSGGVVDYGVIAAQSLHKNEVTTLDERQIGFSINCSAPTKLVLTMSDNRRASAIPEMSQTGYGMGFVNGKKIGVYLVILKTSTFTADGAPVDVIQEESPTGPWIKSWRIFAGAVSANLNRQRVAFAPSGSLTPGAYKTISGTLGIFPRIVAASGLPLTQEIVLDGSATIEVQYI